MNEFTREELECLLATLDKVYIAHRTVSQDELQNKLQSLIDNYCEPCPSAHEFYETLVCHQCGQMEDI